jgi:hypothetical protein
MTTDPKFTDKFLEVIWDTDCVREQSCAVPWVLNVCAVIRLPKATNKQVAWQWRNDDASCTLVSCEKNYCVLKGFSEHRQRADNNVPGHVVFSGRFKWHRN